MIGLRLHQCSYNRLAFVLFQIEFPVDVTCRNSDSQRERERQKRDYLIVKCDWYSAQNRESDRESIL